MNISYLLCAPGHLAINRPVLTAASLMCVLALCLVSLTRLSFEDDISKSFSSDSSYSREYEELKSALGFTPRQIVILAESSAPFNTKNYETLRSLAFELELTDSIDSVFSLASVQFPKNHNLYPDASLLPAQLEASEIEARLNALKAAGLRTPISTDRKSALFVVSFGDAPNNDSFLPIIQQLRDVTRQYGGTNLRYNFTGEDLIGPELGRALRHDLIVNYVVGCLLAIVLALLFFGNIRLVIVALLPALAAALISMATFVILNYPITVLNNVIPILVLVLALADSVHLTLHFRDDNPQFSVRQRVERAVSKVGPACALTAITTAIAFSAIGVSGNQQLKELAAIGTLSVLLAYITVLVSFTLLAGFLGGYEQRVAKPERIGIPTNLAAWILANAKSIYGGCIILVFVSMIGLPNLRPWFNLDEHLPTNSEVRTTNQKIAREFGGIYRIWSILDVSGDNALETEEGWNRLGFLTEAIQAAAPEYPVVSLATLALWLGQPDSMPPPDMLESVPEGLMAQLLDTKGEIARVITIVPEAMRDQHSLQVQTRIEENAMAFGATSSVGSPVIMRHESVSVIIQLCFGLAVACIISVVIVSAFYRWPMLAVALIIPNTLPLAVTAAALAVTHNYELTPTAMLALTVAFGIAIDDSIHLVNRFLTEVKEGNDTDRALQISIQKTGKAMLVTTVLICVGMLSTMISSFETVRLFGEMLILTFITAFLIDILLLPCLLRSIVAKP